MTVESNKTSSNYCNLSWKSLENGSRDKSSLILDCLSRNTTVARIISGSATVSAIKQLMLTQTNNSGYGKKAKEKSWYSLLELTLVSIGHNLYKYYNKQVRLPKTAWPISLRFQWGKGHCAFSEVIEEMSRKKGSCEAWGYQPHFYTAPLVP